MLGPDTDFLKMQQPWVSTHCCVLSDQAAFHYRRYTGKVADVVESSLVDWDQEFFAFLSSGSGAGMSSMEVGGGAGARVFVGGLCRHE